MKNKKLVIFLSLILTGFIIAACSRSSPTPTTAPVVLPNSTETPQVSSATPLPLPAQPSPTPTATLALPTPTSPATEPSAPTAAPTETQAAPTQASPTESSQTNQAETPACNDLAAYYGDVTIPDDTFFKQGDTFTKTWRFRNNGDCTWTPDYKLVFNSGEIMNGPLSQPFPDSVPPGGYLNLSVDLTAPSRGGNYTGYWWFENPAGQRFGTGASRDDTFWVKINVGFLNSQGQAQTPASTTSATSPSFSGCAAAEDKGVEQQVLALINQQRQSNGLPALNEDPALDKAALIHSQDMACNNFVGHNGSDGSTWYDRISAQGYSYSNANENIFYGTPDYGGDAQGAVTWWMNSPIHRDNILNDTNSDIGIGYVYDANSQYGGYYTVDFARP
jgi:uncharacterized protein YkwD